MATILHYDVLVVATGTDIHPEETPGLQGPEWRRSIFDFYSIDGAQALAKHLRTWQGGRLVLNVVENPIKCPVAPLEFIMLADWFFHEQGIRDRVELIYATPLPGAFTKPIASKYLGDILEGKGVKVVPEFLVEHVDPEAKKIVHYDETELEYDLLVTVPLNKGDDLLARSGMGDELNYVPVDKHSFLSPDHPNVFVLGDAASLPTSKSGSGAHFAVDCFAAELPPLPRRARYQPALRRPHQLLHRVGVRQGAADRLQLRRGAAARPLPAARHRPVRVASGIGDEPLGQDDVPLDVLEHPVEGQGTTIAGAHEHVRQVQEVGVA